MSEKKEKRKIHKYLFEVEDVDTQVLFVTACKRNGSSGKKVLNEFIRKYVKENSK